MLKTAPSPSDCASVAPSSRAYRLPTRGRSNGWMRRTAEAPLGYLLRTFPWYIDQAVSSGSHGNAWVMTVSALLKNERDRLQFQ